MTLFAFMGAVEAGLIYSLVAMGVFLSFRVLDFPDLTVDGSFPLGAAVFAVAAANGFSPYSAMLAAALAGFVAGYVTATLHVRLNLLHLLASILVMLALYSVNLRIMGRPNMPLSEAATVFAPLDRLPLPSYLSRPLALAFVVAGAKVLLDWFLGTETGLALRAAGANSRMASANGVNRARMVTLGLGISNAYVAVAGALLAQSEGFSDVTMGLGTIIIGLAAVIVGETLVPCRTIFLATLAAILGSIAYRVIIGLALNLGAIGLKAQDLNLVTALLVIAAIAVSRARHASLARLRPSTWLPGRSRRSRGMQKDA